MTTRTLEQAAMTIVLIGAVLGVLTHWVFRPFWSAFKSAQAALQFIKHELEENSGKSMRDIALRNERRFEFLFDHLGIEVPDHLKTPEGDHRS
jgi:hypothetical protein